MDVKDQLRDIPIDQVAEREWEVQEIFE